MNRKRKRPSKALAPAAPVENLIRVIRGQKVMLDADLAVLYEVETKRLNEAVKTEPGSLSGEFYVSADRGRSGGFEVANCDLKLANGMLEKLTEKNRIRTLLNREREWALYALADLDDGMFEQCEWWAAGDGLALVFHGIAIRPVFVMGIEAEVRELLEALPCESGYLNLQGAVVDAARGIYEYRRRDEMCRMILEDFAPRAGAVEALSLRDQAEIEALFASGDGAGIAFAAPQLQTGFFRGVRERGELIAVAGVHVVSRNEGVAGVGNVFVRADRRGRGLAQVVLSAVTEAVLETGIRTVGLNVEHTNVPAIRAYENLGFRTRFRYFEGPAIRSV